MLTVYRRHNPALCKSTDRYYKRCTCPTWVEGMVGDNYVRITVFLAAVLFLVGIGSSFKLTSVRYALVAFGSVLLVLSIVLILRQPGLPPS